MALVAWSFTVGRFPVAAATCGASLWAAVTGRRSGLAATTSTPSCCRCARPRVAAALARGRRARRRRRRLPEPLQQPARLARHPRRVRGLRARRGHRGAHVAARSARSRRSRSWAASPPWALVVAIGTWIGGRDPILTLVLTGVVVGSLFGAGIALVKYVADPYNQLPAITFWLLGSFTGALPRDLPATLHPDRASPRAALGCCAGASTCSRSPRTRPRARRERAARCASS